MNMKRNTALTGLSALSAVIPALAQQANPNLDAQRNSERPNIVIMISEDLSPRFGCYGDKVAETPNIDRMAQEGYRFTNVHTMAGVSGPSRSGLITGVSQNFTNLLHMRSMNFDGGKYFAVPPAHIKAYPEIMRSEGYFTYCDVKYDYQWTTHSDPGAFSIFNQHGNTMNFEDHLCRPIWNEFDLQGRPFFINYNPQITHESGLFFSDDTTIPKGFTKQAETKDKLRAYYKISQTDPKKVSCEPFFVDTPESRKEIARHYDNIKVLDAQVGQVIANLKKDGLWDNTILIVTTDHGDCLPRSKRDGYDSGTRVPMIMHIPAKYRPEWMGQTGKVIDRLVSFEDLTPTLLGFAGITQPSYMQGIDLSQDHPAERQYIYVSRARQEKAQWHTYFVQDLHFQYVRNLTKDPNGKELAYRNALKTVRDLNAAYKNGTLRPEMKSWYEERPVEEFYDLDKDPNQFHNVINDPKYAKEIARMRAALDEWRDRYNDATLIPEATMRAAMLDAEGNQRVTAQPIVTRDEINGKIYLSSVDDGASMGYSFDGKTYELYTGAFTLPAGVEKIWVKAVRYGWKESAPLEWTTSIPNAVL